MRSIESCLFPQAWPRRKRKMKRLEIFLILSPLGVARGPLYPFSLHIQSVYTLTPTAVQLSLPGASCLQPQLAQNQLPRRPPHWLSFSSKSAQYLPATYAR